jgi:hypothetical protein
MTILKKSPSLSFCLIMDAIGCLSYVIPGLGELSDAVWAPISGIIFAYVFGGTKGMIGGAFNFLEEALPGTDFIPSYTIMWFMTNKLGMFSNSPGTTTIQVKSR